MAVEFNAVSAILVSSLSHAFSSSRLASNSLRPTQTVSFKVLINQDLTGVDLINNVAFVKADATDLGKGTVPPSDLANPSSGPDPTVDPGTPTGIPVDHIHSVVAWKAYEVDGDATVTAVSGGETIEYFIFVRNTGNQDLTNVSIADLLPNGVTYQRGGSLTGNTVNFTLATLAVGATSEAQVFEVQVNDNLSDVNLIRNVAVISGDDLPLTESFPPANNTTPTDPNITGDTGTDLSVIPTADIVTWKGFSIENGTSTTTVSGREKVTYTIYIRNESNRNLTGITVSDAIPVGTTFAAAGNGGAYDGTTVVFNNINVDFGQTTSVSFEVVVDENLTDVSAISNVAFVKADATDPGPGQGTVPPADVNNPADGADETVPPGTSTDIVVDPIHNIVIALNGLIDVDGT